MAQKPAQPPPRILDMEEIIPTIRRHIDEHRKATDKISRTVDVSTACFANVIKPLVDLENAQAGEQAVIDALKYCSPTRECQQRVEEAQLLWQEYSSARDQTMYTLIKAAKDVGENLDHESQKLLDRMLLAFEEYGFGFLDHAGIQKRARRLNRIDELCTEFNRNLRQNDSGEFFTPEEVDGLPAKDRPPGTPGGKEFYSHTGKYMTVLRYAHNQETRKRMFLSHYLCFAENVPIFREVILLRDQNARELQATSHADAKIPYRIAESTGWVNDLMGSLVDTLLPFGRADFDAVRETKRRILGDSSSKNESYDQLMPWDYLYYSGRLDNKVQVDHAAIAEYFPLQHTLCAMLGLFADCLQLRFDLVPKEESRNFVWHEDVEAWTVWDERPESRSRFIGYLFADVLGRPNKYKGNQSVNLQPGYLKTDGTRVYPANTLMCNFQLSPTTGYLLSHNNVVTLFHELGHSIHDLVARTKYARFHGFQVALELGEGIGMMLEQWCWLPEVLKSLSRHYTRVDQAHMEAWVKDNPGSELPPETIPDEVLESRISQRANGKIFKILGMMVTALFDMAVHNPASREALLQLDEVELYKDIYQKLKFRRLPNPSYGHASSGLLLSGYDAGYYSYICAEIFAADMFQTTFANNPLSRDAWQSFRQGILEYGGSRNELEVVEQFLGGRRTTPDVLLAMLGVSADRS